MTGLLLQQKRGANRAFINMTRTPLTPFLIHFYFGIDISTRLPNLNLTRWSNDD